MELLIVDPSESFTQAVQARLQDVFQIRCCGDGEDALRLLKEYTPDLLLLHLSLPRRDGLTVLSQVGCKPGSVLVMTNFLDRHLEKQLFEMGVAQVLVQPTVYAVVMWLMELSSGKYVLRPRERFSQRLQSLGFSTNAGGYEKILLALELLRREPKLQLKEHVYPYVGTAAEKSIRDAIASAYRKGDKQMWDQLFPGGRPSNKAFLYRLLEADRDRVP